LALVAALALGDYLMWNWSLQGGHDVLALVSGLTLVLLAIALIWLLVLNAGRLLARLAQRSSVGQAHSAARHGSDSRRRGDPRRADPRRATPAGRHPAGQAGEMDAQLHRGDQLKEPAPSSKLAA
jgi:hypothetical protein